MPISSEVTFNDVASLLFVQSPYAALGYPFLADRLRPRLQELGDLTELTLPRGVALSSALDLAPFELIFFSGGALTEACVAAAPRLRAIATYTDNTGQGLPLAALQQRGIAIIDYTRGAAPSVAETALALIFCALRRIPMWHNTLAGREPMADFFVGQFCDDPDFVNGTVCGKNVGIIGLGQIGRRIAAYLGMLGATVRAYDPFVSPDVADALGVELVDIDTLVDRSEILVVAVPPTPSAHNLLDRARIDRIAKGSLVVVVTRAHAVDMAALRERIGAMELAGAFDVYDVEPVPIDDPLRGRPNVVHLPHIAGRTVDHSTRSADIIADDFARILRGEPALNAVTPEQMAIRSTIAERPY